MGQRQERDGLSVRLPLSLQHLQLQNVWVNEALGVAPSPGCQVISGVRLEFANNQTNSSRRFGKRELSCPEGCLIRSNLTNGQS